MRRTFWKVGAALGIAAGALLAAPATSGAAVISLNALLQNASFEGGSTSNGCPIGWTCNTGGNPVTSLIKVEQPTADQYPDPNGLPSPLVVPNGEYAAFSPTTGSVMTLSQLALTPIVGADTYTLDFWIGSPLGTAFPDVFVAIVSSVNNNNTCGAQQGWGADRKATLTSEGASATDNNTNCELSLTAMKPGNGDWRFYQLVYSPGGSTSGILNGSIGVQFRIGGALGANENGYLMHLDVTGNSFPCEVTDTCEKSPDQQSGVPEPATLMLLGTGLVGVAATVRRRRQLGH